MPCEIISTRFIPVILALLCSSCGIPRDQRDSWDRIRGESLQVGVVTNPPFSYMKEDGEAGGREIDLVQNFARAHKLETEFISGPESDLIHRLQEGEINLLVGGFSEKTIWKDSAGLSVPYGNKRVVLVQKGENRLLYELEGFIFSIRKK